MEIRIVGTKSKPKRKKRTKKEDKDRTDIYVRVGGNIRSLKQQLEITIEELASSAGVDASFLGNIERGQRKPTLYTLQKLAKALNQPVSELIGYDVVKNPMSEDMFINANILRLVGRKTPAQKRKILKIIKHL